MKTTEEYLNDYYDKHNELSKKGETWRLRVTAEEFISEIEKIRDYEIQVSKGSTLNEYHIQRNIEAQIEILLMEKVTFEEAKAQFECNRKSSEESFTKEVPEIKKRLKAIQIPLSFRNAVNIYRWLWRKQITIEMISEDVLSEFKKTKHYGIIIRRNEAESN
jgi:hypothetical protein